MTHPAQPDLAFPLLYLQHDEPGITVQIDMHLSGPGRVAYFGEDCAAVFTGGSHGVTDVYAELLDYAPADGDLDGWETAEEATIDITGPMVLLPHPASSVRSLDDLAATRIALPELDSGTYMLRVSARGRDRDRSDVAVRLQFWPVCEKADARVLAAGDNFDPRTLTSVTPRHHEHTGPFPAQSNSARVDVSYHSFLISGRDTDPTETYTNGSVIDAGNNLIVVHTGIASGPVDVTIQRFDGDPLLDTGTPPVDASEWDSIDEVTIPVRTDMWVITLDNDIVDEIGSFEPTTSSNTRCFRVCARGRAAHWDVIVDEPTEQYLIQTWPSHGPSMITSVKWTDGVWEV